MMESLQQQCQTCGSLTPISLPLSSLLLFPVSIFFPLIPIFAPTVERGVHKRFHGELKANEKNILSPDGEELILT